MNGTVGLENIKQYWGWFLALGILLMIIGIAAIVYSVSVTLVVMMTFGILLVVSGIAQCLLSFFARAWRGFLLSFLLGILNLVVGGWIITQPAMAALVLTLIIGIFLLITGVSRFILAFMTSEHINAFWFVLSGLIAIVLGVLILMHWPATGFWVIGLFIGIELMLTGWSLIGVSIASRQLPDRL